MKNIITIQHTEAEHHVTKMVGGDTDYPLTQLGREHAHNIGNNLKKLYKDKNAIIYSSDMIRTKETAEIVNEYLGLNIVYRRELREIRMGEAKGKSREWEKQNSAPKERIPIAKYRPFPNAETFEEVYDRTLPILEELLNNEHENIIIVGHGLALLMFHLLWLKIPVDCLEYTAYSIRAGAVSSYTIWENKRMLIEYQNTTYAYYPNLA